MKNEYDKGGMKAPDVDCLNRALKMRQFVRAHKSDHTIADVQSLLTGYQSPQQEYHKVTEDEAVTASAQTTINILTDNNRTRYEALTEDEYECDRNLIEEVCSINIKIYLERKNRPFAVCINKAMLNVGILTLGDLVREYESENDRKLIKAMKILLSNFPKKLIKIAECYNENDEETNSMEFLCLEDGRRLKIETITAKEYQTTLKTFMGKTERCDFKTKLNAQNFNDDNITRMRKNCHNSKLRNIYFRLTHNDFFTRLRMKKYKMVESDECERCCNNIETTKHLFYDCVQVKNIWIIFNEIMTKIGKGEDSVRKYEDIYKIPVLESITIVKLRIIQEMVQIIRPKEWNMNKVLNLIKELKNMECYNSKINGSKNKFKNKWLIFENILRQ
jgi:hypothetical protein